MNYLRVYFLLFTMAFIGIYAGVPMPIEKDSPDQKSKELTVEHKDNPKNQHTVLITVAYKGDEFTVVNLVSGGKNKQLTTVVKDGKVSVSFEIKKTHIEKGLLKISSSDPSYRLANCAPGFLLYLKSYVA